MNWDPTSHYKEVEIAEKYDRERFSSLAGRIFDSLEKGNVREALKSIPRDARVLDVPCGTGRFAETLMEEGFSVVGVDISPAMLEVACRKLSRFGERLQTRVADVRELAKLEQQQYDVVLCARVLMHFPFPEQIEFLGSVVALTKRGGMVIFNQSYSTPYYRLRRLAKRPFTRHTFARYPLTEDSLQELLKQTGLREVRRLRPMPLVSEAMFVVAERL